MSWTLLPGVRQDSKGLYQIAVNSRGKQDRVPYKANGAPQGYTIPVREPIRRVRPLTKAKPKVKRLMVIHSRKNGEEKLGKLVVENAEGQHVTDACIRTFLRSPDCGSTWRPAFGNDYDHFFQYHIDEEQQ